MCKHQSVKYIKGQVKRVNIKTFSKFYHKESSLSVFLCTVTKHAFAVLIWCMLVFWGVMHSLIRLHDLESG